MTNLINKKKQDIDDFINQFGLSSDATGYEDDEALEEFYFTDYLDAAAEFDAPEFVHDEDITTALYLFNEFAEPYIHDLKEKAELAVINFLKDFYYQHKHENALTILKHILNIFVDDDEIEIILPTFNDLLEEYENDNLTYIELYEHVEQRRTTQQALEEFNEIGGYLI